MNKLKIEEQVKRVLKEFMGSDSVPAPKKASTVVGSGSGGGGVNTNNSETQEFTPEEKGVYDDLKIATATKDMSAIAAAKVGGMSKTDAELTLRDLGKKIEDTDDVDDELNQKLDILLGKE